MPFDPEKVDWKLAELDAAAGLDKIYEGLADGIEVDDLLLVMEVMPLWEFLKSGSRKEYADKIIALGVLLYRDNADEWFAEDEAPVPE